MRSTRCIGTITVDGVGDFTTAADGTWQAPSLPLGTHDVTLTLVPPGASNTIDLEIENSALVDPFAGDSVLPETLVTQLKTQHVEQHQGLAITHRLGHGTMPATEFAEGKVPAGTRKVQVALEGRAAVLGTNHAHLHAVARDGGREVLVVTVIDNLLKGASGQAIQNFNLAVGLDETAGLL